MLKKLFTKRILQRIYLERAGEPFIYNLVSLYHLFFSDLIKKIDYDLVPRQPYAFGINESFKIARSENVKKLIFVEFGVASGTGLFNMAFLAKKLSGLYNIDYEVVGFDTGEGMPLAIDYRDHPEKYRLGDFPPSDKLKNLPQKTRIYYGDITEGLKQFHNDLKNTFSDAVIGFSSIDVDYYSSTLKCLELYRFDSRHFLSRCPIYLDDVNNIDHNPYCGELLAIKEFNREGSVFRKITQMTQLRSWRIFKNALWIDQMYFLNVFDHKLRSVEAWSNNARQVLHNPY